MNRSASERPTLWTLGHSTRTWDEFLSLLDEFRIETIVDVRRFPSSRKFPHFNRSPLEKNLREHGVRYVWLEALGGRRHGRKTEGSLNTAFRSRGFRNYADYMLTDEFREGAEVVLAEAAERRTVVLCAEKLYWNCHRRLLSDYLAAQGFPVEHIQDSGEAVPHVMSPGCTVTDNNAVIYPGDGEGGELFEKNSQT